VAQPLTGIDAAPAIIALVTLARAGKSCSWSRWPHAHLTWCARDGKDGAQNV
jgi:hypothetical protein